MSSLSGQYDYPPSWGRPAPPLPLETLSRSPVYHQRQGPAALIAVLRRTVRWTRPRQNGDVHDLRSHRRDTFDPAAQAALGFRVPVPAFLSHLLSHPPGDTAPLLFALGFAWLSSAVVRRTEAAGPSWPLPEEMDEEELERLPFPPPAPEALASRPPSILVPAAHAGLTALLVSLMVAGQAQKPFEGVPSLCNKHRVSTEGSLRLAKAKGPAEAGPFAHSPLLTARLMAVAV